MSLRGDPARVIILIKKPPQPPLAKPQLILHSLINKSSSEGWDIIGASSRAALSVLAHFSVVYGYTLGLGGLVYAGCLVLTYGAPRMPSIHQQHLST